MPSIRLHVATRTATGAISPHSVYWRLTRPRYVFAALRDAYRWYRAGRLAYVGPVIGPSRQD